MHGLRARGFHAGNVLVYGAAALAVFALALLLFDHWGGDTTAESAMAAGYCTEPCSLYAEYLSVIALIVLCVCA